MPLPDPSPGVGGDKSDLTIKLNLKMKDFSICFRKIMCNSGKAPPTQGEGFREGHICISMTLLSKLHGITIT
jgi:hypothetical protein